MSVQQIGSDNGLSASDESDIRQWQAWTNAEVASGQTPAAVRTALISHGWADADADRLLAGVPQQPQQPWPGSSAAQPATLSYQSPQAAADAEQWRHDAGRSAARDAASKNMLIGGLWCGGGLIVTIATYSAASGGGSYVVAWGAILFGGIQFMRGLGGYFAD